MPMARETAAGIRWGRENIPGDKGEKETMYDKKEGVTVLYRSTRVNPTCSL